MTEFTEDDYTWTDNAWKKYIMLQDQVLELPDNLKFSNENSLSAYNKQKKHLQNYNKEDRITLMRIIFYLVGVIIGEGNAKFNTSIHFEYNFTVVQSHFDSCQKKLEIRKLIWKDNQFEKHLIFSLFVRYSCSDERGYKPKIIDFYTTRVRMIRDNRLLEHVNQLQQNIPKEIRSFYEVFPHDDSNCIMCQKHWFRMIRNGTIFYKCSCNNHFMHFSCYKKFQQICIEQEKNFTLCPICSSKDEKPKLCKMMCGVAANNIKQQTQEEIALELRQELKKVSP